MVFTYYNHSFIAKLLTHFEMHQAKVLNTKISLFTNILGIFLQIELD